MNNKLYMWDDGIILKVGRTSDEGKRDRAYTSYRTGQPHRNCKIGAFSVGSDAEAKELETKLKRATAQWIWKNDSGNATEWRERCVEVVEIFRSFAMEHGFFRGDSREKLTKRLSKFAENLEDTQLVRRKDVPEVQEVSRLRGEIETAKAQVDSEFFRRKTAETDLGKALADNDCLQERLKNALHNVNVSNKTGVNPVLAESYAEISERLSSLHQQYKAAFSVATKTRCKLDQARDELKVSLSELSEAKEALSKESLEKEEALYELNSQLAKTREELSEANRSLEEIYTAAGRPKRSFSGWKMAGSAIAAALLVAGCFSLGETKSAAREWTEKTGRTCEATYISHDAENVVFSREFSVPVSRLSDVDRAYLNTIAR